MIESIIVIAILVVYASGAYGAGLRQRAKAWIDRTIESVNTEHDRTKDTDNVAGRLWAVRPSIIEGMGVIATTRIAKGTPIGYTIHSVRLFGLLGGVRTTIGKYCNHAKDSNCILVRGKSMDQKELENQAYGKYHRYPRARHLIVAKIDILEGEEITIDYDSTPWFMASAKLIRKLGTPMNDYPIRSGSERTLRGDTR